MNITYFQVTGNYCHGSRWRNLTQTYVIFFKQFVTAVGIYAATNPSW